GLAIAVGIRKQYEIGTLRNVYALGSDLKSDGQVQTIRKYSLLIRFAVVVRVFKDEDFVIGFGITWLPMRVRGHDCHPKTPLIIKRHLHRFLQFGKLFLGGKKFD